MKSRLHLATFSLLFIVGVGCTIIGLVENPAPLSGPAYWAAATGEPGPTVTVLLGTTTPVVITTTPNGSPVATTTPGLPIIGFTTPVPGQTPYYRVGTFYMHSDVYIGGPDGLVFRLTAHETQPSPNDPDATYHFLSVLITNYTGEPQLVPLSDLFFIRQVWAGDEPVNGRWVPQTEPLLARNIPSYSTQQLDPLPPDSTREINLGFVVPNGDVNEIGLITHWNQPVEGGRPIWFYLEPDPIGPFEDALQPPPPTPILLDDDYVEAGSGSGMWPTTGTVTRGFGCHELYTGIDGAGFGCPPAQPWFHNGVDIANAQGTAIWSPVDGTLAYAGPNSTGADCSDIPGSQPPHEGLGNYQRINGDDGLGESTTHYLGHLSSFLATSGSLTAGQHVAGMGSTGCSTGSHLHWIVYQNGNLIDPAQWAGPGPSP